MADIFFRVVAFVGEPSMAGDPLFSPRHARHLRVVKTIPGEHTLLVMVVNFHQILFPHRNRFARCGNFGIERHIIIKSRY